MTEPDNLEKKYTKLFIQSISVKNHKYYRTIDRKLKLFAELYVYAILFYKNYEDNALLNKVIVKKKLDTILSIRWRINNIKDLQEVAELYSDLYYATEPIREKEVLTEDELKKYSNISSSIIRKMKIELLLNGK